MSIKAWLEGAIIAAVALLLIGLCLPLGSVVTIGPDEHFETTKGWLAANQWKDLPQMWNDQPMLWTVMLASVYKIAGNSLLAGRLLAVGMAGVGLASLYMLCKTISGRCAAVLSLLILIGSPGFIEVAYSPMLEMPAFALSLLSIALLFTPVQQKAVFVLCLSGCMFGLALNLKLTAGILLPTALVAVVVAGMPVKSLGPGRRFSLTPEANALVLWSTCTVITAVIVWIVCPNNPFQTHLSSHAGSLLHADLANSQSYALSPAEMLRRPEYCLLFLGFALVFYISPRRPSTLIAFTCLSAVISVHFYHRPWWSYYWLHFGIAFAICGGLLVQSLWEVFESALRKGRGMWRPILALLSIAFLSSTILGGTAMSLKNGIVAIKSGETISEVAEISLLKPFAHSGEIVYCANTKWPMLAGCKLMPQLAVLPQKRVWSKQLSMPEMCALIIQEAPGVVALTNNEEIQESLINWLGANYNLVGATDYLKVYHRKPQITPASFSSSVKGGVSAGFN